MSLSPLISVVIPAYNAERFLAEAIASVHRQSHAPLEIIVIDDGSTDRTAEIARAGRDVWCWRQPNGGIGSARNAGVAAVQGDLLAFLDADDLWTEDKLARQLAVLQSRPEIDLVAGQVEQFFDESYAGPLIAVPEAPQGGFTAGAMLIRKSSYDRVGGFRTDLAVGEFLDWHSRAVAAGLRMASLDEVVLRRRIHGNNTVIRQRGQQANYLSVLKSHLDRKRRAA
ncbi:MAG: glycosyltransferase family A protein [Pirellulaceae bacterium]|nr:glycosyltransferase family A protein [Pirellulaceae bacterium]